MFVDQDNPKNSFVPNTFPRYTETYTMNLFRENMLPQNLARKGICLQYMTANTINITITANALNITIITVVIQKFIKNISFWRNENIQTNTFNCL